MENNDDNDKPRRKAAKLPEIDFDEEVDADYTEENQRLSNDLIEKRRLNVLHMKLRGLSFNDISQNLGVSQRTIVRDYEIIRKENARLISNADKKEIIADALAEYDDLIQKAWQEHEASPKGTMLRLKSLDLVRVLKHDKLNTLKDCGILDTVVEKVEHKYTFGLEQWNDPAFRNLVAEKILMATINPGTAPETAQLEAPKDIVDAEVIEIKEETNPNPDVESNPKKEN